MKLKEKFKLNDNGRIFNLPLSIRERVHKEVSELLIDVDSKIKEGNSTVEAKMREWPVKYLFDKDGQVVVIIPVLKPDKEEIKEILTFNFHRNELDKLIKD